MPEVTLHDLWAAEAREMAETASLPKSRSAQAHVRNRRAIVRVGTGDVVVLGLSSARALRLRWRKLELQMRAEEKAYHKKGAHVTACALGGTADGIAGCIKDLRRHMESAMKRQPQHNV